VETRQPREETRLEEYRQEYQKSIKGTHQEKKGRQNKRNQKRTKQEQRGLNMDSVKDNVSNIVENIPNIGTSTATQLPEGGAIPTRRQPHTKTAQTNGVSYAKPPRNPAARSYNHVFPIHRTAKVSPLGYDAKVTPSFFGVKNLMALMLGMNGPMFIWKCRRLTPCSCLKHKTGD